MQIDTGLLALVPVRRSCRRRRRRLGRSSGTPRSPGCTSHTTCGTTVISVVTPLAANASRFHSVGTIDAFHVVQQRHPVRRQLLGLPHRLPDRSDRHRSPRRPAGGRVAPCRAMVGASGAARSPGAGSRLWRRMRCAGSSLAELQPPVFDPDAVATERSHEPVGTFGVAVQRVLRDEPQRGTGGVGVGSSQGAPGTIRNCSAQSTLRAWLFPLGRTLSDTEMPKAFGSTQ